MNAIVKELPLSELGRLHAAWQTLKTQHQHKVASLFRAKNLREGYKSRVDALQVKKSAADKSQDKAHEAWVAAGAEGDAPPSNWTAENQFQLDSAISDSATNDRTIEALSGASLELEGQAKRAEQRFRDAATQIYEEQLFNQLERIVEQAAPIAAHLRPRDDIDKPVNEVESPSRARARRVAAVLQQPTDWKNTPINQLGGGNGGTQAFEAALNTWIKAGCDGALV
jgi:hypothetical protein